jgi:hypothetical protein
MIDDTCHWCLEPQGPNGCVPCRESKAKGLRHRITHRVQSRITGRWGTCNNEHPKVNGQRPVLWDRHKAWVLVDPTTLRLSSTSTAIPGITPGGAFFTTHCNQPYTHHCSLPD